MVATLTNEWFASPEAALQTPHGAVRCRPAAATVAALEPRLRSFGITRVADITGLDHIGIPVVMVTRPNGRSLSVSQGKGMTLDDAKASGIMESIEQMHAESIDRPVRFARYRELRRAVHVADPADLARPDQSTYRPDVRLPWIEGRRTASREPIWLPLELADIDSTVPAAYPRGRFVGCTNGLASGNTMVEAESHGLCEAIERDARTLWALSGAMHTTRIDPASIDDVGAADLLGQLAEAEMDVGIWDMTSDVGVAAIVVVLVDRGSRRIRRVPIAEGAGCHPNRNVALRRALTEAAQARLTVIAGSRDDIGRDTMRRLRSSDQHDEARTQLTCIPARRSFGAVPSHDGSTIDDDFDFIMHQLADAAVPEPLTIDLTQPDVGIPVVKMVVPTLEPALERSAVLGSRAQAARAL